MSAFTLHTACGGEIVLTEETMVHLEAHPEARGLLAEAIARVRLPAEGDFLKVVVDLGRVIGQTACVETNCDVFLFAVRKGRTAPTRVVVGVEKSDTTTFVVLVHKDEVSGQWVLNTGYAGADAPREPHDRYFDDKLDGDEFVEALKFWSEHALVWDETMGQPYESTWEIELGKVRAARVPHS